MSREQSAARGDCGGDLSVNRCHSITGLETEPRPISQEETQKTPDTPRTCWQHRWAAFHSLVLRFITAPWWHFTVPWQFRYGLLAFGRRSGRQRRHLLLLQHRDFATTGRATEFLDIVTGAIEPLGELLKVQLAIPVRIEHFHQLCALTLLFHAREWLATRMETAKHPVRQLA